MRAHTNKNISTARTAMSTACVRPYEVRRKKAVNKSAKLPVTPRVRSAWLRYDTNRFVASERSNARLHQDQPHLRRCGFSGTVLGGHVHARVPRCALHLFTLILQIRVVLAGLVGLDAGDLRGRWTSGTGCAAWLVFTAADRT